jgi:hypothetical protein
MKMETQQMMELLLTRMDANQETMKTNQHVLLKTVKGMMVKMSAKMDAQHKKMMAIIDAHHERTVASLGKMEAKDFKAIPEEMETVMEHQEIPKEDATVMPVGELRKRRRVCNLATVRSQKMKKRTREKADSRGSWLPPAGRCPTVQKWHGEKGTSSGMFRPKEIVDCERD